MVGKAYWNSGLYIAKGMVESHGDKIWAHNNADGNGATFTNLKRCSFPTIMLLLLCKRNICLAYGNEGFDDGQDSSHNSG